MTMLSLDFRANKTKITFFLSKEVQRFLHISIQIRPKHSSISGCVIQICPDLEAPNLETESVLICSDLWQ